jgi:nucleoid-associated protein YgaU
MRKIKWLAVVLASLLALGIVAPEPSQASQLNSSGVDEIGAGIVPAFISIADVDPSLASDLAGQAAFIGVGDPPAGNEAALVGPGGKNGNEGLTFASQGALKDSAAPAAPALTPAQWFRKHFVVHWVRRGENLSRLAWRFDTSVWRIVHINHIRNPNLIFIGQRLVIPVDSED